MSLCIQRLSCGKKTGNDKQWVLTYLHWLIFWILISLPPSRLHFISIALYNMGNHFPENYMYIYLWYLYYLTDSSQYLYKTTEKQSVWNFSFHLNCFVHFKLRSCVRSHPLVFECWYTLERVVPEFRGTHLVVCQ